MASWRGGETVRHEQGSLTGAYAPPRFLSRARPRLGVLWPVLWAVFLVEPLTAAWDRRDTPEGVAGLVATAAFAAWYIGFFARVRGHRLVNGWLAERPLQAARGVGVALSLAALSSAVLGQAGTVTAVYVGVMLVVTSTGMRAVVLGLLHAALWYLAGFVVPGWMPDNGLLLGMLASVFAVFAFQQIMIGNARLREAERENQRLAVEQERNRFARDLHDILGHSLTVITVKAELAARLMGADPSRARAEVEDLERLSRDALADVRRAVAGYREVTLPGELAHARTALEAAEIDARLPLTTDAVEGELRELFAWAIREGVTNVVRHSGATQCTVLLGAHRVEVRDNGRGRGAHGVGGHGARGVGGHGVGDPESRGTATRDGLSHGLVGLRERAAELGADVVVSEVEPHGFSLVVEVPGAELGASASAPVSSARVRATPGSTRDTRHGSALDDGSAS